MGIGLEATGGIEAGGQFIGERLVVHQAVVAGRADGLFVKTLGVELAAFEAGDLGAGQGGAACEVLRAVPGPLSEPAVVGGQGLQVAGPLCSGGRVAERGFRQPSVEMIVRPLEDGWRHPEEVFRFRGRRDGGGVVAGEDARLQLADPVQAGGDRQARVLLQMLLEPALVKPCIVEGAEDRGLAAERPDEPELCGDEVDDKIEAGLAREVESGLSLALHLGERIAAGETLGEDIVAAEGRVGEVAGLLRGVEGVPGERAPRREMPPRGFREVPEGQVHAGLEAVHAMLLHHVKPELAEAEPCLVVAEI